MVLALLFLLGTVREMEKDRISSTQGTIQIFASLLVFLVSARNIKYYDKYVEISKYKMKYFESLAKKYNVDVCDIITLAKILGKRANEDTILSEIKKIQQLLGLHNLWSMAVLSGWDWARR